MMNEKISYGSINLEELKRLPDDFPNLESMKKIWKHNKSEEITNPTYISKLKAQVKNKVDGYLEMYNAGVA